jgi:hypothetical protein
MLWFNHTAPLVLSIQFFTFGVLLLIEWTTTISQIAAYDAFPRLAGNPRPISGAAHLGEANHHD